MTHALALDLGLGVRAEVQRCDEHGVRSEVGAIDGVAWSHTCSGVPETKDYIPVKPLWQYGWDLISETPLTLSPSLLCTRCGFHGFVRDGKWVPA